VTAAAAAAAVTVFERVIATTGAKATEARIRTNNKNFSAYLRISSSIISRKVISDGILLITAYKQNTEEERNKAAMKTLSLSLRGYFFSLSLRDQTCEGTSTAAAEEILGFDIIIFWRFLNVILIRQKKNYGNSNISPCKNIIFKKNKTLYLGGFCIN
jgi:hypothetical protein